MLALTNVNCLTLDYVCICLYAIRGSCPRLRLHLHRLYAERINPNSMCVNQALPALSYTCHSSITHHQHFTSGLIRQACTPPWRMTHRNWTKTTITRTPLVILVIISFVELINTIAFIYAICEKINNFEIDDERQTIRIIGVHRLILLFIISWLDDKNFHSDLA